MSEVQDHISKIREGFLVVDLHGDKVGDVNYVHLGATVPDMYGETSDDQVPRPVQDILSSDQVPSEIRRRLLQRGFIRVNPGLLRSDRYIFPNEITKVNEGRVMLNKTKKSLLSF